MSEPILEVTDLRTEFETEDGTVRAVNDVSFALEAGDTMGIVGESGAGKSVTARSILRLIDSPGEIVGGSVVFDGTDLLELSDSEMRGMRGNQIALVPQDPMSALNPVLSVGKQIVETVVQHQDCTATEAREIAIESMESVEIPDARDRLDDYPHEFSGGMRQRVLIAIALSCEPDVLIADEPTTALDVTTQAKILDLLDDLQAEHDLSILLITHNLGVVAQTCDRVGVMYAGNLIETADIEDTFERPRHPYTRALIDAIPAVDETQEHLERLEGAMPDLRDLPDGCNFAPRCSFATEECRRGGDPTLDPMPDGDSRAACIHAGDLDLTESGRVDNYSAHERAATESTDDPGSMSQAGQPLLSVQNLTKHFSVGDGLLGGLTLDREGGGLPTIERQSVEAVDGVSFDIESGETLGLVGESGCGKSTVAKTVLRLLEPTEGEIYFRGEPFHELNDHSVRSLRSEMQMIFQDPVSSLNPRKRVGDIIGRAMERHDVATGDEKRDRVEELLEEVGLSADAAKKYPHEFSGGQAQRVGIAHALAAEPQLIVCDEPVSALDVSVQAQILDLLDRIQEEFGLSYLFISHDISVIRHVCDRVAVMYLGELSEVGPVESVFSPPHHPYTESLLSAVPHADPGRRPNRILLEGTVPSPVDPPSGCPFQTRCPKPAGEVCEQDDPTLESISGDDTHRIACHLSEAEMSEGVSPESQGTPTVSD